MDRKRARRKGKDEGRKGEEEKQRKKEGADQTGEK
jgi:hypothetical protein